MNDKNKLWTHKEVLAFFEIDEEFLRYLEQEKIVCPVCSEDNITRTFTARDVENLRLTRILMEELNVNLAGVEVILNMRRNMIDMRKQFDAILEEMAAIIRENR